MDISINSLKEQHGGNLAWVTACYPQAPKPFVDLSTGINPYGYPLPAPERAWNYQLPEAALMQQAMLAAAHYYRAPDQRHVALAYGMQPLMAGLAGLRLQKGVAQVGILSPTYSEHERIWGALGHACSPCTWEEAQHDIVIVCNPNNPDGRRIVPEQLLQKARQLAAHGGWLIVDESFGDLEPQYSVSGEVQQQDNLIVLRSCGKFFGIAGMRISAAVAARPVIDTLRVLLGPWPISTVAANMLPVMLQDTGWVETMRQRLHLESAQWRQILAEYFTIAGHTALFTLVETPRAEDWHNHLAAQGLLVRRFDYNPRWLRLGLPPVACVARVSEALAKGPQC